MKFIKSPFLSNCQKYTEFLRIINIIFFIYLYQPYILVMSFLLNLKRFLACCHLSLWFSYFFFIEETYWGNRKPVTSINKPQLILATDRKLISSTRARLYSVQKDLRFSSCWSHKIMHQLLQGLCSPGNRKFSWLLHTVDLALLSLQRAMWICNLLNVEYLLYIEYLFYITIGMILYKATYIKAVFTKDLALAI